MPPDITAIAPSATLLPRSAPVLATPAPALKQSAVAQATPHASPVSLLDPSTGLVVIQFYNAKGDETASLPTKKQLDLYRLNEPSFNVFQPAIHDVSPPPPKRS